MVGKGKNMSLTPKEEWLKVSPEFYKKLDVKYFLLLLESFDILISFVLTFIIPLISLKSPLSLPPIFSAATFTLFNQAFFLLKVISIKPANISTLTLKDQVGGVQWCL